MAAVAIGEGRIITITAGGTVSAGDVWEGAGAIGVYLKDAVSGDAVAVAIQGEYSLAKQTTLVISAGDKVYYDVTADEIDKTNTNVPAGICTQDAASAATTVRVLLNPGV